MNRFYFLITLIFCLGLQVSGQNADPVYAGIEWEQVAVSNFNLHHLSFAEPGKQLTEHFQNSHLNFTGKNSSLKLLAFRKSPGGHHFTYIQNYRGFPLFNSNIKINLDHSGSVLSLFDNSFNTVHWGNISFSELENEVNTKIFLSSIRGLGSSQYQVELYTSGILVNPETRMPIICVEMDLSDPVNEKDIRVWADFEGRIIKIQNRQHYYSKSLPDSLVMAKVFLPDPLTSAGMSYGGSFMDFDDLDIPVLNDERVDVELRAKYTGGLFSLENNYIKMIELQGPSDQPPVNSSPEFFYTRGQDEFEWVNTYYHLNRFLDHIHQLGFSDITGFQLNVDAHGTDSDNSFFISSSPPKIILGTGGVDDGEDADVIIHEYGHALSYWAAPNTVVGHDRFALDEGLGDYFAASYSRSINPFSWAKVFTWDGHNEYWLGRDANTSKVYPADKIDDIYRDGEIWSSAIMDIWEELGRDITDQLMLQALYGFGANMTMRDAAQLILQADQSLNSGSNYDVIYHALFNRGLIDDFETSITGTYEFVRNNGDLTIFLSDDVNEASVAVFDIMGRLIHHVPELTTRIYTISSDQLHFSGLYFVRLRYDGKEITEKAAFIGQTIN